MQDYHFWNESEVHCQAFKQGTLEQSYKLDRADVIGGVNGVFEMLDEEFMKQVLDLLPNEKRHYRYL